MNTNVPEFGQSDALRGDEQIETLQRKLKGHGFYRGTCDGEYGEELQLAINRFRARVMKRKRGLANQAGCDSEMNRPAFVEADLCSWRHTLSAPKTCKLACQTRSMSTLSTSSRWTRAQRNAGLRCCAA
jgi:hypothetical protein